MSATGARPRRRAAVVALCAAALTGCTASVRLSRADLAEQGDDRVEGAMAPTPRPDAAAIAIAPVEDRRPDTDSLGQIDGRSFSSSELKGFVDEQLAALASPAFAVVKGPATRPARLALRPRILKAYVRGIDVTKAAVVVLEVEFVAAGAAPSSRVFRGQDASLNWGNGQGEVARALQRATVACLEQLRVEIEQRLRAGRT